MEIVDANSEELLNLSHHRSYRQVSNRSEDLGPSPSAEKGP